MLTHCGLRSSKPLTPHYTTATTPGRRLGGLESLQPGIRDRGGKGYERGRKFVFFQCQNTVVFFFQS